MNIIGFLDSGGTWQPVSGTLGVDHLSCPAVSADSSLCIVQGLYSSVEMFDPSDEWFFGVSSNNNFGWFPSEQGSVLPRQLAFLWLPHLRVCCLAHCRRMREAEEARS